jgi:glycerol-3-phosphate dehydrogenase (NAD(P)+)
MTRGVRACARVRCPAAAFEILERVLPKQLHSRLAFLSGPSFAAEVAQGLPTVVTIAAKVRRGGGGGGGGA